jgi:uncharacterized protein
MNDLSAPLGEAPEPAAARAQTTETGRRRLCDLHPWLPWVAPFALYMLILGLGPYLPLSPTANHILRLVAVTPLLVLCGRRLIAPSLKRPLGSVAIGAVVFVLWVAPDYLFPGYRGHWLLSNGIVGEYDPGAGISAQQGALFLVLRVLVSVLLVPVVEELFWRGFLMRILIRNRFEEVPMGTWQRDAFWITAILFALEHGSYWDVGLMAGVAYNFWLIRTRNLGDVILAHAVTNGLLAAYVMFLGRWEFWP